MKNAYEMKTCENASQKLRVITEQRVHKFKYEAFYSLLREKREDLKTFSLDCQQNQVLPKVSDQEALLQLPAVSIPPLLGGKPGA